MKTLGIDPGNIESGFAIYDSAENKVLLYGTLENDRIIGLLSAGAVEHRVEAVGIEQFRCYGMAVGQTTIDSIEWAGRFHQVAIEERFPVTLVPRMQVKKHICNNGAAKDGNIRQALIDKIGPQGKKKTPGPTYGISGDAWAALAIAVTLAEQKPETAFEPDQKVLSIE